MRKIFAVMLGLLVVASGACQPAAITPLPPPAPTRKPQATQAPFPTFTRRPTRSPSPRPSVTPTPSITPTFTPGPSLTRMPTGSETLTPALTPGVELTVAAFPMAIQAMRQGSYPGSDIIIDQELPAGSNYRRFYVHYLSEGLKIYALLTLPNGTMPAGGWPGIVFNHGYIPPREYRTTERYVAYVDQLARSGYIVFRIDYRGHDRSEGDPQGAYGDPGYEVDVLNALASLKRFDQINPQKIGMWGHSMGGYLTLRAMVISPDIKAGVIWAGVVAPYADILYNWPSGPTIPPANSRKWMDDWPAQFGTPEQNPLFWSAISANSYLGDLSGPLQLHYGTLDEEVPPQFTETLAQEVQDVGGSVEVYAYAGDNHNITFHFTEAMSHTIDFFNRYLK